jgi:hypothetical protein
MMSHPRRHSSSYKLPYEFQIISYHIFEDIAYITKEHTSQYDGLRSVIDNKVELHMFNFQT